MPSLPLGYRSDVSNGNAAFPSLMTVPPPISWNGPPPVTCAGVGGIPTTTVGQSVTGVYGTLVLQADGSYQYDVQNANPTVNALKTGQQLQDVFSYAISDGLGGTAFTTLTITINGNTDVASGPSIVAVDGNGAAVGEVDRDDRLHRRAGRDLRQRRGDAAEDHDRLAARVGQLVLEFARRVQRIDVDHGHPGTQDADDSDDSDDLDEHEETAPTNVVDLASRRRPGR